MFNEFFKKLAKMNNYAVIIILSFVFFAGQANIANADTLITKPKQAKEKTITSREIVTNKLIEIGYSASEAADAVKDLSKEEINYLAKNPRLIKKKGIIIIILVCLGITATIAAISDSSRRTVIIKE